MTPAAPSTPRRVARACALIALVLAVAGSSFLSGCKKQTIDVPPVSTERPAEPRKPKADLTTPENAVRSYLDFVSYAYLLGKSEVASQTMGPAELARVDGYIGLDRKRGRKIDQQLKTLTFGKAVAKGADKQLVPANEAWVYRYVDLLSGTYKGGPKRASLDATFTVERGPTGWLVTSVEATATTPVR